MAQLDRAQIITALERLSQYTQSAFPGRTVQLLVHGGAYMLLHPKFSVQSGIKGSITSDVDFFLDPFVKEAALKWDYYPDVTTHKLAESIKTVAREFELSAVWLNSIAECNVPVTVIQ